MYFLKKQKKTPCSRGWEKAARLDGAVLLLGGYFLLASQMAIAQIIPDGSLPNNTIVTLDGNSIDITGGTRAGVNLFHSFAEFSILPGGEALFNNALDIENIIARVTGGKISQIDGIISASGSTNLFLLNPSGIVFGPGARLNVGGSFLGSSADSLAFSDGSLYSAREPNAPPLLTVNVPMGLQYGANPGAIRVEGTGNPGIFPSNDIGLAVPPGNTLALVGGNVTLRGGVVSAANGRIEIGSIANGSVGLTPIEVGWRLDYGVRGEANATGEASETLAASASPLPELREIQLLDRSSLWNPNFNSNPEGGIQVTGARVIVERSQIAAITGGSFDGADIAIDAAESIEISGATEDGSSSWIVNQVLEGTSGNGGAIIVGAPQLTIQDGGRIQTLGFGSGATGNVTANADEISISGFAPPGGEFDPLQQNSNSRISSENFGAGAGGNVEISARAISLRDGGQIGTLVGPTATGNGGNVTANAADSITAIGINPFNPIQFSKIGSDSLGAGAGGDIAVSTSALMLSDGGSIQSTNQGTGVGGDITVNASESLVAIGVNPLNPSSASNVLTITRGPAPGGNVRVSTGRLQLRDGGTVGSFSVVELGLGELVPGAGTGKSGDVTVFARESVEAIGASALAPDNISGLASSTFGSGDAGNVSVSTKRLILRDGATVASSVVPSFSSFGEPLPGAGTGNGGNLTVNASESIEVIGANQFNFLPSSLITATAGTGNAGNATVNTQRLLVRDGGSVNSVTAAAGNAGQMTINAESIIVSGTESISGVPAEVSANALLVNQAIQEAFFLVPAPTGDTGELTINADRLTVRDGGRIGVQHDGTGNAGRLQLNASQVFLESGGSISATTSSGFGGNVTLNVRDSLQLRSGSPITVEVMGGMGNGGNLSIEADTIVALENSDIVANAVGGNGGNIQILARGLFISADSDITASSQRGIDGTIEIQTPDVEPSVGLVELNQEAIDLSALISRGCEDYRGSSFAIAGRGGLPEDPAQPLESQEAWQDLRFLSAAANREGQGSSLALGRDRSSSIRTAIVEATGWIVSESGEIELVARLPDAESQTSWNPGVDCSDLPQ